MRDEVNEASSARLNKKIVELQSHISYRLRYSLRVTLPTFTFISIVLHHSHDQEIISDLFIIIIFFLGLCLHVVPQEIPKFQNNSEGETGGAI